MPPKDSFVGYASSLDSPSGRWVNITPDNNNDLAEVPRFLMVAVSGNVECVDAYGTTSVFAAVAGHPLRVRPVRVRAAATTATGIVACY